jgi:hypothetical protein
LGIGQIARIASLRGTPELWVAPQHALVYRTRVAFDRTDLLVNRTTELGLRGTVFLEGIRVDHSGTGHSRAEQ